MSTFAGLRSRCTKPCEWNASTASAILDQQQRDLARCERSAALRDLVEWLTLDVLERDERVAQRLVDAEHRDDRWVVERLETARLREEVVSRVGIGRTAEDLHRDGAVA
jgi:hypothetical protein